MYSVRVLELKLVANGNDSSSERWHGDLTDEVCVLNIFAEHIIRGRGALKR